MIDRWLLYLARAWAWGLIAAGYHASYLNGRRSTRAWAWASGSSGAAIALAAWEPGAGYVRRDLAFGLPSTFDGVAIGLSTPLFDVDKRSTT